jgi:hypothetical protein
MKKQKQQIRPKGAIAKAFRHLTEDDKKDVYFQLSKKLLLAQQENVKINKEVESYPVSNCPALNERFATLPVEIISIDLVMHKYGYQLAALEERINVQKEKFNSIIEQRYKVLQYYYEKLEAALGIPSYFMKLCFIEKKVLNNESKVRLYFDFMLLQLIEPDEKVLENLITGEYEPEVAKLFNDLYSPHNLIDFNAHARDLAKVILEGTVENYLEVTYDIDSAKKIISNTESPYVLKVFAILSLRFLEEKSYAN